MPRAIAIDFGLKRCGLAVTDELRLIASGLDQISSTDLESYLGGYILKENVDTIVIGYPTNMDGSDTDITANVRLLKDHLSAKYPTLAVVFQDERFTSSMASKSMIEMGMKKKNRRQKGMVDEISAVLILQAFLERV